MIRVGYSMKSLMERERERASKRETQTQRQNFITK